MPAYPALQLGKLGRPCGGLAAGGLAARRGPVGLPAQAAGALAEAPALGLPPPQPVVVGAEARLVGRGPAPGRACQRCRLGCLGPGRLGPGRQGRLGRGIGGGGELFVGVGKMPAEYADAPLRPVQVLLHAAQPPDLGRYARVVALRRARRDRMPAYPALQLGKLGRPCGGLAAGGLAARRGPVGLPAQAAGALAEALALGLPPPQPVVIGAEARLVGRSRVARRLRAGQPGRGAVDLPFGLGHARLELGYAGKAAL